MTEPAVTRNTGQAPNSSRQIGLRRQILFGGIFLLLCAVVLSLVAEGGIRIRQWIKYGMASPLDATLRIDEASKLRIPAAGKTPAHIRINGLGFRSPELRQPKPPAVVRVAFLGASTTYCAEVSNNEATWPDLVWRAVQDAKPGVAVDYVNAAVPGYTVGSSLRNLEFRVKPLAPDVIVLYEGFNDMVVDTAALARQRGLSAGFEEDSWLARHSLLWYLVEKNLRLRLVQTQLDNTAGKLQLDSQTFAQPFKQRLTELVAASQHVAPVVAVATLAPRMRRTLPREEQRQAASSALYFMPYMSIDGILDAYEAYNRAIRAVAAERQTILVDAAEVIPADGAHYTDSVHFSDAGSRVMAQHVARALLGAPAFGRLVASRTAKSSEAQR